VWRKTLGTNVPIFSGADGSGNGLIDEADRLIWRANFGRTATGAGAAQTLALSETSTGDSHLVTASLQPDPLLTTASLRPDNEGVVADAAPVLDSNPRIPDPIIVHRRSLVAESDVGTVTRRRSSRPPMRGLAVAAASHDDGLVAWLASRSTWMRHDDSDMVWHRSNGDTFDCSDGRDATIDLALASLWE
jgi:hypothetical protein